MIRCFSSISIVISVRALNIDIPLLFFHLLFLLLLPFVNWIHYHTRICTPNGFDSYYVRYYPLLLPSHQSSSFCVLHLHLLCSPESRFWMTQQFCVGPGFSCFLNLFELWFASPFIIFNNMLPGSHVSSARLLVLFEWVKSLNDHYIEWAIFRAYHIYLTKNKKAYQIYLTKYWGITKVRFHFSGHIKKPKCFVFKTFWFFDMPRLSQFRFLISPDIGMKNSYFL